MKFQVITEAIPKTVGGKLIGLVTSRAEIPELLKVSKPGELKTKFIKQFTSKIETLSQS